MEAFRKGLKTDPFEPLLCAGSLISDLVSLVLKYRVDCIIYITHKQVEIFTAPREIHAAANKTSKYEVNVLRGNSKDDLMTSAKQVNGQERT
jgi:hypothetical protein